jgi:F-type H+-transporting ATPase subunit gamma
MLSTRDIRRKIKTVRSIEQICRAMKTISSMKLRRAEQRILSARPYASGLADIMQSLRAAAGETGLDHPLLASRPLAGQACATLGIIAVSADKGLCGGYNANVLRETISALRRSERAELITIGRKATSFFQRRQWNVRFSLWPLPKEVSYQDVRPVADRAAALFEAGEWDAVRLIYTRFLGGTRGRLVSQDLLPISAPAAEGAARQIIFEPPARELLSELLPRYLRTIVLTAVLEAAASEHGARAAAMAAATDNAEDLTQRLTLEYNKARQAGITKELLDIVGTAEAVR